MLMIATRRCPALAGVPKVDRVKKHIANETAFDLFLTSGIIDA
jgi:hypothetical protein